MLTAHPATEVPDEHGRVRHEHLSYGYLTAASQTPDQPLCRSAERHHHGTGHDA